MPALARLIVALGHPSTVDEVAARFAALEGEAPLVLVAEDRGEVIGCLTTSVMRVLHRPAPVGRISMLVVDEARRGEGVGALLVRAAEAALLEQGCYMVEVTSNLKRERAHRFYEQIGYARTSLRLAREL